jgi:hypothetical protein
MGRVLFEKAEYGQALANKDNWRDHFGAVFRQGHSETGYALSYGNFPASVNRLSLPVESDSPLEERGFEPLVPLARRKAEIDQDAVLCG